MTTKTPTTKKSLMIFSIIAVVLIIILFFLYWWRINSNLEQKKMNNLLAQINDLYIANEYIQEQYDELERQQENLHGSAELNRAEIDRLRAEFREIKGTWWMPWMLTEDWDHQLMPELESSTEHERFKELAKDYGLDAWKIREVENFYWIKEWVVLCITIAETSWGNRWYGKQNIWSVWSNDRWDRPVYALMETWLEWIGKTLNNKYLWKTQTLWCLSNAWNCKEDISSRYATSEWNRERNMVACLSSIYGEINPSTFIIRR